MSVDSKKPRNYRKAWRGDDDPKRLAQGRPFMAAYYAKLGVNPPKTRETLSREAKNGQKHRRDRPEGPGEG